MFRTIWLMVTSYNAAFKAYNFLKLIKPPDGTEMTDQVIKLDWNRETGNQWTVAEAKPSMEAAGFAWEKRTTGGLGEDNFRVTYADAGLVLIPGLIEQEIEVRAGEPVRHFEVLEQWMGPALAPADPHDLRDGIAPPVESPAGSLYDKWPDKANPDGVLNAETWITVLAYEPITDSDVDWWRTIIQKTKDTAARSNRASKNERGDSLWYSWTSAQDPDLGGDQIWMFEQNADGEPAPIRPRMRFAV